MLRSRMMQGLAAAIAIVALTTAAHATLSVLVTKGLLFKGQFWWNSEKASVVSVRVQNTLSTPVHVVVDVKARAEDGSTVGGFKWLGLAAYGGREVSINLAKPITALQFTQIRTIP